MSKANIFMNMSKIMQKKGFYDEVQRPLIMEQGKKQQSKEGSVIKKDFIDLRTKISLCKKDNDYKKVKINITEYKN